MENKYKPYDFRAIGKPLWDFDNPLAKKTAGEITYRITDENIVKDGKKQYTLYANKEKAGKFNSVTEAKMHATALIKLKL